MKYGTLLVNFSTFQIKWKQFVVGFYSEENDNIKTLNLFISYVAYSIH